MFSWLALNQTDPDGTMSWFLDQLVQAERAGDKVHIVAHIPGGGGEALEGWSINYYNIINRFILSTCSTPLQSFRYLLFILPLNN